ncbi:MAG TPA: photosynthetic reaction center cytochrome c subunit family protein [Blastocatellia bacterium]|nr:photosynthetic reaction center cytochrome c subunit family protein [Blastocatellia bacterium]
MIRGFKLTLFALFCFFAVGQYIGTGASSQDPPAEKFFKNIQALKGIPAGRIAGLMDSYNKALGVSCEYCHVAGDLSKADKPTHKTTVRDILMTREINEKYKHTVDCMSCHQGKAKPSGIGAKQPDVVVNDTKGDDKGKMTFTASAGKVPFPHDTHMAMGCTKCHHQGGNSSCATCHKHNAGDAALSFKTVSHSPTSTRGCTGCHKQMSAGPQACGTCHVQEATQGGGGGGGATPKAGPAKLTFAASFGKVGFPHDRHMTMDCSKCHHQGGTSACGTCHKHNAGDAGLSFKKVSHSTTSSRACMACHKQMSVGPRTCASCHKP